MRISSVLRTTSIATVLAIPGILTAAQAVRIPHTIIITFYSTIVLAFVLFLVIHDKTTRRPLIGIMNALNDNDKAALQRYASTETGFGYLSRLLIQSLESKVKLDTAICERVKTEAKSREVNKQYRMLFDNSLDAILCTDRSGSISDCNQAALTLFKAADRSVIMGKDIAVLFDSTGKTVIESLFSTLPEAVAACDFECCMHDTCENVFDAAIRYSIDSHAEQPIVQFCIRNITTLKIATSGKVQFEKHLQHLLKMEAVGQLADKIAHEYNNIFGAVSGYADLIKHHYSNDSRLQRYAQMIHSGTKRASLLTGKLLTFARIKKSVKEDFDSFRELGSVGDLLACTLPQSVALSITTSGEQGIINGDPAEFRSAVMNLAINASTTLSGGGTITISAAHFTADSDTARNFPAAVNGRHYIAVSCSDSGPGMDESTVAHLFEPFHQNNGENREYGLGLASVYGTLMSHDGFIDVASTPGKGSCVTLYFPWAASEDPAAAPPSPFTNNKPIILAADDETTLQETLADMLELLGYQCTMCSDGTKALSAFSLNPDMYSLVLLDMNMPGMSGLDCYRKMREIKSDVRTLIMTGYYLDEESQQMIDKGIRGLILKPFIIDELGEALSKALSA